MLIKLQGIRVCENFIRSQDGIDYALNYYRNKTGANHSERLAELYEKYPLETKDPLPVLSALSVDLPKEKLQTDLDKFMLSCTLGIKNCTKFPYAYYFKDQLYGSCLDLNKGVRNSDNSIVPGSMYEMNRATDGLNSFFYIGQAKERFQNTLSNAFAIGLIVKVYNQSDTVLSSGNEVIASPGYCTTIRLSKTIKTNMPEPYSRCQDLNTFSSDLFDRMKANNITYRQSACIEICLHEKLIKSCSCYFNWFAKLNVEVKACVNSSEFQCGYETFQNNIDQLSGLCLSQCNAYFFC